MGAPGLVDGMGVTFMIRREALEDLVAAEGLTLDAYPSTSEPNLAKEDRARIR